MEHGKFESVEDLFHRAKDLAPAERATFLDEACAGDLELRAEVESLLVHSDRSTAAISLRNGPDGATLVDRGPVAEGPGTRIGPYKVLQLVGEGGFGAVYMAEQLHPVRRKVAVKIIKLGMDTKQVIARFEAERQALALMDHPNIARVLDAGATETGRPYFVMEFVKGVPLMEYCDGVKLSLEDRLTLFMDVCHAVQHAHHKGIIHRDLKPSNVLVTLHDGRPVPKVIDFGIAKATSQSLTEKTLFTEFRQLVGTPEYMSPEQAEMSGLDVDTRADIYSLGVLLYELLTGTTPFDSGTLRSAGYGEIQRIIREEEPPKPSTRLNTLVTEWTSPGKAGPTTTSAAFGETAEDIAKRRRTDIAGLSRLTRGDLDWIVMKAIEKDRTRRYETCNELAADLQRHLDRQPVLAGPPSMTYKFAKFLQRHRASMIAGTLVTLALILGIAVATIGFVRAQREATRSRQVSEFLQDLTIRADDADSGDTSVGAIVSRGRELFGDDHAVVGTLLSTRASTLNTAARVDEAIQAQREALSYYRQAHTGDHPTVAEALSALGGMLQDRGDSQEAESIYREALAMKSRLFGGDSEITGDALEVLTELLVLDAGAGRREELKDLWFRTIRAYEASVGREHRKTVLERAHLGRWLHENGFYVESEPLLVEAVEQVRRVLGDESMTLFVTVNALAQHRMIVDNDIPEVVKQIDEMIRIGKALWGPVNDTIALISMQGVALNAQAGNYDAAGAAIAAYVEDRATATDLVPGTTTVFLQHQVAAACQDWLSDNPDVGYGYYMLVLDDTRHSPAVNADTLDKVLAKVADWLDEHERGPEATPLYYDLVALRRAATPIDKGDLASALVQLGARKVKEDRPGEAEPLLREAVELRREIRPPGDWSIASARGLLGTAIADQGDHARAEPVLLESHEVLSTHPATPDERRTEALEAVIRLYEDWGRPDEAALWRAKRTAPIG